jgi:hypothetical protein
LFLPITSDFFAITCRLPLTYFTLFTYLEPGRGKRFFKVTLWEMLDLGQNNREREREKENRNTKDND